MTREEIDALDLDALNIECAKAMGWVAIRRVKTGMLRGVAPCKDGETPEDTVIPDYSRDIGAAWVLVNASAKYMQFSMSTLIGEQPMLLFTAYMPGGWIYQSANKPLPELPAMICRAFLVAKAVGQ